MLLLGTRDNNQFFDGLWGQWLGLSDLFSSDRDLRSWRVDQCRLSPGAWMEATACVNEPTES